MPSIYTITEVAQLLKCSPQTVQRMIKGKSIKAFKVLGTWRITEKAIEEFIKKGEVNETRIRNPASRRRLMVRRPDHNGHGRSYVPGDAMTKEEFIELERKHGLEIPENVEAVKCECGWDWCPGWKLEMKEEKQK